MRIPFVCMVKFKFLAHLQVDHLLLLIIIIIISSSSSSISIIIIYTLSVFHVRVS